MLRRAFISLAILVFIQFSLGIALSPQSFAKDWAVKVKPQGTLKVVDFFHPSASIMRNYAEGLVTMDKYNNLVPCLAEDWRWVDDITIEFKLRQGVTFHNGEKFNADAVKVNWKAYKEMQSPRVLSFTNLPDETVFQIIDEYTIRFTLPEPVELALVRFRWFMQIAPAFFSKHNIDEKNWAYISEAGPWGTGPFRFVEGSLRFGRPSDRVVLEAYEGYWDHRYPKLERVIFDNKLVGDRKEAMRLCRESEGTIDLVSAIRPLDTLKVMESPFAKVVKSMDVTALVGWFNQRKKDSKWRDIRLRRAVNYAVNRKELWKYGAKGNAYNLGGFIPPGAYGHNPNLKLYNYDTTKARSLLAEAGYPDGFEVRVITPEAWRLETQIIKRMLERIGLRVKFDVLSWSGLLRKYYIHVLDNPPEKQDWDLMIANWQDFYGHTGAVFLALGLIEKSDTRWIEHNPIYEEMWKEMSRTVGIEAQKEKIRQMVQYIYDRAYSLFIYSPITLYAVNKEVNFVPQKNQWLRLKETSVTDNHWSVSGEKK